MTTSHLTRLMRLRVLAALFWAMPLYWLAIFPRAGRELSRWRRLAQGIPDPTLRRHALVKLDEEHLSAEGAAAFAILAPRRHRPAFIRACVAFEVMYDYLDALTEAHPTLANNRRLHRALVAAVDADAIEPEGFYAHHPQRDDGGYLEQLVATCRDELVRLPQHRLLLPGLRRMTERASEAQSLNHSTAGTSQDRLAWWAASQPAMREGFHWWEIAAGSGSPLGIYALIAAACDRRTSERTAADIETAFFPSVAALEWLLESLVDRHEDQRSGNPSYVSHYRSIDDAKARVALIAGRAVGDVSRLQRSGRYVLLLLGMIGMHLSGADADDAPLQDVARSVEDATDGLVRPFVLVLRLRRGLKRRRRLGERRRAERPPRASTAARRTQRDDRRSRGGDVGVQSAGADREGAVDA